MFDVGTGELILILVVALLLFGGRLPEVARSVGRSVAALKRGIREGMEPVREIESEVRRELRETGDDDGKTPA